MAEDSLRLAARASVVWALLAMTQAVLVASELMALPVATLDVAGWQQLLDGLTTAPDARALVAQAALAASVAWFAGLSRGVAGATVALGLAVVTFLPPTLVGHVATGNGIVGTATLSVHVAAAALWVGGLAALALLTLRGGAQRGAARAISRYSTLALACVVAVAVSGTLSAAAAGASLGTLLTSPYGAVLVAKVGALVLLAACGWLHRRRTVERLRLSSVSRRHNRRRLGDGGVAAFLVLASFELVLMSLTLALAVGLARTPTPDAEGLTHAALSMARQIL